ncbi:hypothetical protein [Mycolicibacter sinensis]
MTGHPPPLPLLHAARDETGRYLASPHTQLRARWTELFDVLTEWCNCYPKPAPTAEEWQQIAAAIRATRVAEDQAKATAGLI